MRILRSVPVCSFTLSLLAGVVSTVQAQQYDPIIENFRLTQEDQLTITRGGPVDRAGDVNGDGFEDLLVATGVGAVRVVYGPTEGFNGVVDGQQLDGVSGFVVINDAENDSVVGGLGDINGDGLDDIGVASLTGTRIIFGSASGFSRVFDVANLNGANGFVFDSAATDIKRAGDINNDGLADFIVGNANASPNGLTGAGVSYVIFGSQGGFPANLAPTALNGSNGFSVIGQSAQDRTGAYVSGAGDFNNDGFGDVLIGAPNQTADGKAEAGFAYLVLGAANLPAVFSLADINGSNGFAFRGSEIQNMTGASVGAIGDLNHDGVDDIAIGAPGKGPFGVPSDYAGQTFVLFGGNFSGTNTVTANDLNGGNGFVVAGIRGGVIPIEAGQTIWGDLAGVDVDGLGDMNGDGIDDMIIGASHTIINPRRKGVGQAYFLFGSNSAYPSRFSLNDLDGSNGFRINGEGTVDYYGVSLAGAGDFNDDNIPDAIVGASGQGETYVFYGRETSAVSVGDAPVAAAGTPTSGFTAAVLDLGADAPRLVFNERPDPTGDSPLPVGTLTDPLNPATPGFTAPNPVNTDPVQRTLEESGDTDDETNAPPATPPNTPDPTEDNPTSENNGDSANDNDGSTASDNGSTVDDTVSALSNVSTGGAMSWFPLLLLISVVGRFKAINPSLWRRAV